MSDANVPTLRLYNHCGTPVEVRIPDCLPCDAWTTDACFDCAQEWVQLEGTNPSEGPFELIFQLDLRCC